MHAENLDKDAKWNFYVQVKTDKITGAYNSSYIIRPKVTHGIHPRQIWRMEIVLKFFFYYGKCPTSFYSHFSLS